MSREDYAKEAFHDGKQAFREGVEANPFPWGCLEFRAWASGYEAAGEVDPDAGRGRVMRLAPNADSLEYVTQAWWLARTRLRDCAGDEFTMRVVRDTLLALRLNEFSPKIADLADEAVQEMYARRRAVG